MKQLIQFTIIISILLLLAACKVKLTLEVETRSTNGGQNVVNISGSVEDIGLVRGISFNASSFEIDISQSSVTFPESGSLIIELLDSSGATVGANSFEWFKQLDKLLIEHPTEVETWVADISSSNQVDGFNYTLNNVEITDLQIGQNTIAAAAAQDDRVYASDTQIITIEDELPPCWGQPNCYIE